MAFVCRTGLLASVLLLTLVVRAEAQGYPGLLAAPQEQDSATQNASPPAATGYAGLTAPFNAPPSTKSPDAVPYRSPQTSEDLVLDAFAESNRFDPSNPPDALAKTIRDRLAQNKMPDIPRPRVDGLLEPEVSIKKMIAAHMKPIEQKNLSPDERKKRVQQAYDTLSTLATGLMAGPTLNIDDLTKLGFSENYVREEQEIKTNGLKRLNEALNKLKSMM